LTLPIVRAKMGMAAPPLAIVAFGRHTAHRAESVKQV
jgi:hypothetical protein